MIMDATHSLQQPNQNSGVTGGMPNLIETIAKAAIAVGADGLFLETHPNPSQAKSDGANMLQLDLLEGLRRIINPAYSYPESNPTSITIYTNKGTKTRNADSVFLCLLEVTHPYLSEATYFFQFIYINNFNFSTIHSNHMLSHESRKCTNSI